MFKRMRGFTLVELLVVIGIIGLLFTIVLAVTGGARGKARDATRTTAIQEMSKVMEQFYTDNGHYPISTTWSNEANHPGNNWIPNNGDYTWSAKYISSMPRDPLPGNPGYAYESDGATYQITAQLENATPLQPTKALTFNGNTFSGAAAQPISSVFSSSVSSPTGLSQIPITLTFSAVISDFSLSALVLGNASIVGGFQQTVASVYNFFVTASGGGTVTVGIGNGAVHDSSGNANTAANFSLIYDSELPHVALSPDPLPSTVTGSFTVFVNTTLPVSDFSASSISVQNGTVSNAGTSGPQDGENYSFTVTPTNLGTVTVIMPANAVHSGSGNGNVASNSLQTTYSH